MLDGVDNIIPYIPKEEDKVEKETRKILGRFDGERIIPAEFGISCTCTRVGVLEGHTEVVHVQLEKEVDEAAIVAAWQGLGADFVGYPSCPPALIHVHEDPFRPQVRLDRDMNNGMTTVVGRLRPDPHVKNGWKYMLVSHNTKMGAASGCVLVAEHLVAQGFIRAHGATGE
jgi:aspartate-semialdehyde dehydrogenase